METKKVDATGLLRAEIVQGENVRGKFSMSILTDGSGILIEYSKDEAYLISTSEIVKESLHYFIPEGTYCEGNSKHRIGYKCPFWGIDKEHPDLEQENGYCSFLGKSDWDFNEEKHAFSITTKHTDGTYTEEKFENTSAHDIDLPSSLLWDGIKECGIKDNPTDGERYITRPEKNHVDS